MAEHPGRILKKILAEKGLLQSDLAFILGQRTAGLNQIIAEKRGVSADMSKALGEALGLRPDYFANLQIAYEIAIADDPDPSVSLRASLLSKYPIRDMIRRGWIEDSDAQGLQMQLAQFFGLDSVEKIPYLSHAAKKSSYEEREIAPTQIAWLFRVKQIAKSMTCPKYSPDSLSRSLEQLRDLLAYPEEARHIPRMLAECGVRFVIVETLPQAKIDGVCFWLDSNTPVIGMSTRYDRIDNFFFVLRHEIEHVLRGHGKDEDAIDAELEGQRAGTDSTLPEQERIANVAAADFCIPAEKIESFIRRKHPFYYEKDVLAFAKLHNIHPGIVVGQMQHRLDRYNYLKKHQVRIRHFVLPGARADGWGQTTTIALGRMVKS